MSSLSPDPYRSPALRGFAILGLVLVVLGGFVLDDSLGYGADDGGVVMASILLGSGALSLVVAAVTLGTRLGLVEHEQARPEQPTS